LPAGYELENTIFGTYLKKSGVKSALFNFYQAPIYATGGAIVGFFASWLLKYLKK